MPFISHAHHMPFISRAGLSEPTGDRSLPGNSGSSVEGAWEAGKVGAGFFPSFILWSILNFLPRACATIFSKDKASNHSAPCRRAEWAWTASAPRKQKAKQTEPIGGGGVADRKAELGFGEGEEARRGASSPRQDPGPEQGDRAEHGAGGGLVPNMHPAGMVGLPSAEVLDPMSLSFLICQMGRRMVPTSQIM